MQLQKKKKRRNHATINKANNVVFTFVVIAFLEFKFYLIVVTQCTGKLTVVFTCLLLTGLLRQSVLQSISFSTL